MAEKKRPARPQTGPARKSGGAKSPAPKRGGPARKPGAAKRSPAKPGGPPRPHSARPGGPSRPHSAKPNRGRQQPAAVYSEPERLQKIIADAGLASRRGAEKLIAEGRVSVDGQVVEQAGLKVDPARAVIAVDGRPLPPPQRPAYFMFHKPDGCLTTLDDPKGRPTIKPYLDKLPLRVFPVGRLDMDVEGLLILTNDGDLAKKLMHPSFQVPKVYRVKVSGRPDQADLERLRSGTLMLGRRPAAPAGAELIKEAADRAWLLLTLTEGRHHQVKRMCSAVGHPVLKLKRVAYAGLELGTLRREMIRPLTREEVQTLKEAVAGSRNSK